jgi:hypothetical protein
MDLFSYVLSQSVHYVYWLLGGFKGPELMHSNHNREANCWVGSEDTEAHLWELHRSV